MNYNKILNVPEDASVSDIKRAYRSEAKKLHPDHNNSPEAAEAFKRITEAQEKLIAQAKAAEKATPRDDSAIRHSTAAAVKATAQAAFRAPSTLPTLTDEEIEAIQALDHQAAAKPKRTWFGRIKDTKDVIAHRRKLKRNNRRIDGKY